MRREVAVAACWVAGTACSGERANQAAPEGQGAQGGSGASGGSSASAGVAGDSGGSAGAGAGGSGQSGRGGGSPGGSGNSVVDPGVAGEAPYDWVGVIGTGQSLGAGWDAPAISVAASAYGNLTLLDEGPDPKYPIDGSGAPEWSVVPLSEPIRRAVPGYDGSEYPNNIWHLGDTYGETPHSGMANSISEYCLARDHRCVTAHSVVAVGGATLAQIARDSYGYRAALNETSVFKDLAEAAGNTYGVGSIVFTHGESDAYSPSYAAGVYEFWQNFNADIKAITGQAEDVVMLASQQSSANSGFGDSYGSAIQLWQVSVEHPDQIVCTGPKYQYGSYGLHMGAESYARLGEKYGQVHDYIVNRKIPWRPLEPTGVSRSGAVLTIDFHVPVPPLEWDETLAPPHQVAHQAWSRGRGFEVITRSGEELEIASVEIQGESVVLTLEQTPPESAELVLGYAVEQDTSESYQGGTALGPHGQLRDSDPFTGLTTDTVEYNYCVHFAMDVP